MNVNGRYNFIDDDYGATWTATIGGSNSITRINLDLSEFPGFNNTGTIVFYDDAQPEMQQEKEEPMRSLWKVYLVNINTLVAEEELVVADDESKAKVKAMLRHPNFGDIDDLDLFAEHIGEVREPDEE